MPAYFPPGGGSAQAGVLNNFAASAAPTSSSDASQGYSVGSSWLNQGTGEMWRCRDATTGAARWVKVDVADHPGYVPGRYYVPFGHGNPIAGVAGTSGTIYLLFGVIKERISISQLGARITTAAAGGNFQLAIYNHNAATGMPSTLVAGTGSGSTAAGGIVGINLASNLQLEPGPYWFAIQADNSTAAFMAQALSSPSQTSLVGDAVAAIPAGTSSASLATGFQTTGTFGTWPADLTSNTLTVATQTRNAMVQFLVASVP